MKNVLRLNVIHDGKSYAKGSACPVSLVKNFSDQGLLEASEVVPTNGAALSLGEPGHAGSELHILPETQDAEEEILEEPKAAKKKAK